MNADYNNLLLRFAKTSKLINPKVMSAEQLNSLPNRYGNIIAAIECEAEIAGYRARFQIGIRRGFPSSLPIIFLKPWDRFGLIPHVETDGYVCVAQDEGLILDPNRMLDILKEAFGRAIKQIEDGIEGKNYYDFVDEFQPYWNRQKDCKKTASLIIPTPHAKLIQAFVDNGEYKFVCDKEADLIDYYSGHSTKHLSQRNALYIPLAAASIITPPYPDKGWTPKEATEIILKNIDEETIRLLPKITRKLTKHEELIVIFLPKADSMNGTLFGVLYKGVRDKHPLAGGQIPTRLHPVILSRHDRGYVMPRGGGQLALQDKRAAVIGCGSIGGHLSIELARAGIRNLTLVDHEQFKIENAFRHVLGKSYLNENKAVAMKKYIESTLPYMNVIGISERIEDAISHDSFNPSAFDLIISALGMPSVELYLNRLVVENSDDFPPFIYTWVEAFGIGEHVQVTNNRFSGHPVKGCLECLYTPTPDDEESHFSCRASFAQPNQEFGRNISGCSGLFTPYGSLSAVRAAVLATQAALDVLSGKEKGNPLLSCKGPSSDFLQEGLLLSSRYNMTTEELYEKRYVYVNERCQACGKKNG